MNDLFQEQTALEMARILFLVAQRECLLSDGSVVLPDLNANKKVLPHLLLFQYVASFLDKVNAQRSVLGMQSNRHNF